MSKNRELPAKESATFKSVLKFYEHRQYKKGLKSCEQILKKHPEHGETLAMKGLFCSHLDRKDEAHEFIKKGIRQDITSHICWHVYGLFHRAEKNYPEALKCYGQALKFDKENQQIARDHSLLQVQMRMYDSFCESKYDMLQSRPKMRGNWTGLAIAYHLLGKYDLAAQTLTTFEESFKDEMKKSFENSEHHLYKNYVLELGGQYDAALQHLDKIQKEVLDTQAWKEAKARILLKANKTAMAELEYGKLIKDNPENLEYIAGLQKARGLDKDVTNPSTQERLFRLFKELRAKHPYSFAIQQIPLTFTQGELFKTLLKDYMTIALRKGIPSLFTALSQLIYKSKEKLDTVQRTVSVWIKNLEVFGNLNGQKDGERETPTTLLWAYYFMAQHHDYLLQSELAIEYINKAIAHTPTLVELYMVKAKIYKHAGAIQKAAEIMNDARELDLQDRFVNSKCVKYMLRAGKIAKAEDTVSLFTRSESKDPLNDLVEMQCHWYTFEAGKAHMNLKETGKALKKFHQIEKTFADVWDDQFDFHTYSLRKMTLRSYIDLLETEDRIRVHPFFKNAAIKAVEVYLSLAEAPNAEEELAAALANMSVEDRKKHIRKMKKAELKKTAQETTQVQAASVPLPGKKADADPFGNSYLQGNPLDSCMVFLKPLLEFSPKTLDVQILGARVYTHKKKYLLAFQCIKKALALAPSSAAVFRATVALFRSWASEPEAAQHPHLKAFMDANAKTLLKGTNMDGYIDKWTSEAQQADQFLAAWSVLTDLGKMDKGRSSLDKITDKTPGYTLPVACQIQEAVKQSPELSNRFMDLGKKKFKFADVFHASV